MWLARVPSPENLLELIRRSDLIVEATVDLLEWDGSGWWWPAGILVGSAAMVAAIRRLPMPGKPRRLLLYGVLSLGALALCAFPLNPNQVDS